jgi:single-strand DNA-binding protein
MFAQLFAIGRVGKDPEPGTESRPCRFSIATSRTYKDRDGNKQEETEWINLVAWGAQGETIAKYVKKGRILSVQARPVTRSYEKDGVTQKRTEYVLENFQFLPDGGGKGKQSEPDDSSSGAPSGGSASDGEDDIPF